MSWKTVLFCSVVTMSHKINYQALNLHITLINEALYNNHPCKISSFSVACNWAHLESEHSWWRLICKWEIILNCTLSWRFIMRCAYTCRTEQGIYFSSFATPLTCLWPTDSLACPFCAVIHAWRLSSSLLSNLISSPCSKELPLADVD